MEHQQGILEHRKIFSGNKGALIPHGSLFMSYVLFLSLDNEFSGIMYR